jgi:hypothetical protein
LQNRVVAQDRRVEVAQLAAGREPQLRVERAVQIGVDLQRLGLAAGPVEREHEQRAQTLAERVPPHQRPQFQHEVGVPPLLQIGLDPQLGRLEPQLIELADRLGHEGLVLEVGQRAAAPQPQRLPQGGGRAQRVSPIEPPAAIALEVAESEQIELLRPGQDRVAG